MTSKPEEEKKVTAVKEKATVVVVNTQARLLILSKREGFNGPEYRHGKWLLPGENNVDKAFWDVAKKSEGVKDHLLLGNLKCKGEGEAKPITDNLASVNALEAFKIIGKEEDPHQLIKWKDNEARVTVKKACDDRFAFLSETYED